MITTGAVAAAALLLSLPLWADSTYVQTLDDFRMHMTSHIHRVRLLGLEAYRSHPQLFPDVDPKLLSEFLGLHDQSKVNQSAKFLATHNLQHEKHILERLYENYGLDFPQLPPARREQALALVARLNKVDNEVAHDFFRAHGMLDNRGNPNAVGLQYLRIEKLSDLVDRGENPVSAEEFHKPMTHASQMMKNTQDQQLARRLQQRYELITRDATYSRYRQRRTQYCVGAFQFLR